MLSDAAYDQGAQLPSGWKAVPKDSIPSIPSVLWSDNSSGFSADLYQDANGNYVLAFRGTEAKPFVDFDIKDIETDLLNPLTTKKQYIDAANLAAVLETNYPGLILTGHSLGGGLAQYASSSTGLKAVTFNAANPGTALPVTALPEGDRTHVTNYRDINDPVSAIDEITDKASLTQDDGQDVYYQSAATGADAHGLGPMQNVLDPNNQCGELPPNSGNNGSGNNTYPTVPGGCFGNLPLTDGQPSNFLDLLGQMVDVVGSQSTQDVLGNVSGALDVLDKFTDLSKAVNLPGASTLESIGKFTGPLGDVLQILSVAGQLAQLGQNCTTALASGSEQDFVNAINDAAKSAVSTLTSMGGSALGGVGGTFIGGPVGTFVGGWLGGLAGEAAGNWAYDKYMKDWVTTNIGEKLFDLLCPQSGGGGGTTSPPSLPPSSPPGNTGTDGSDGSGQPGAGITDPSQIINSGTGVQPQAPATGPGYQRDPNYRQISH